MTAVSHSAAPSVSVVVPFFNDEARLRPCIEALLSQEQVEGTYELIFIDNASSDRSAALVREYPEVRLLSEGSQGAYMARNTGLAKAKAPILAFTDADCVADPDWLSQVQRGMVDPTTAMLVGRIRYPPTASGSLRLLGAYENAKLAYVLERGRPSQRFAHANNMAVRASLFRELGPFREWRRAGDSELVHRIGAERPDLRVRFRPEMRVTHNEFVSSRERVKRLRLYSNTNARISSFEELTFTQRCAIVLRAVRTALRG